MKRDDEQSEMLRAARKGNIKAQRWLYEKRAITKIMVNRRLIDLKQKFDGRPTEKPQKKKRKKKDRLEELRRALKQSDPQLSEDSETFKVALILISSGVVGTNQHRIAKFAGLPRNFIKKPAARLRKYGIWNGSTINCEWLNKEYGDFAFWMDVCVAMGDIKREQKDGQFFYQTLKAEV